MDWKQRAMDAGAKPMRSTHENQHVRLLLHRLMSFNEEDGERAGSAAASTTRTRTQMTHTVRRAGQAKLILSQLETEC